MVTNIGLTQDEILAVLNSLFNDRAKYAELRKRERDLALKSHYDKIIDKLNVLIGKFFDLEEVMLCAATKTT